MDPIINRSLNITHITWEIIHSCLLHTSGSVMETMCRHHTLTGTPKNCQNKTTAAPCTICSTEKNGKYPKIATVNTTNLHTVELFHPDPLFYNVTSI